jgi:hypothetical protein
MRRLRQVRREEAPEGVVRLHGYGLLSLALESGDVVMFRRVMASSMGPPFTTLWHRDPAGEWRFHVNVAPARSCLRFLGAAPDRIRTDDISVVWKSPHQLALYLRRARLHLALRLEASTAMRALGAAAALVPGTLWQAGGVLRFAGRAAGAALGAGSLGLSGYTPTGHAYRVRPRKLWGVAAAAAVLDGRDLGALQERVTSSGPAGLVLPRRPLFATATIDFLDLAPFAVRTNPESARPRGAYAPR